MTSVCVRRGLLFVLLVGCVVGSVGPASAQVSPVTVPGGASAVRTGPEPGFGMQAAAVGDLNDDGHTDVAVNAAAGFGGRVYVYFGPVGPGDGPPMPGEGFTIETSTPNSAGVTGDSLGLGGISPAGDQNGDGIDDLLIGVPRFTGGLSIGGGAAVVYGGATGPFDVAALTATQGFRIDYPLNVPGMLGGFRVTNAGDQNGDGIDDLAIGRLNGSGFSADPHSIFVLYGTGTNRGAATLSMAMGADGYVVNYPSGGPRFGVALSAADITGTTTRELLVGAPGDASYIIPGGVAAGTVVDAQTDGLRLFSTLSPAAPGTSIAAAGDVNGDGRDDAVIGGGGTPGEAWVVYGRTGLGSGSLDSRPASEGFRIIGRPAASGTGASVGAAGDHNGDGRADVALISVGGITPDVANVDVVHAPTDVTELELATMPRSSGYTITGLSSTISGFAGSAGGSWAGDQTGDGRDDLLVGEADQARKAVYVVRSAPIVSIEDATTNEAGGTATVTLRRTGHLGGSARVDWATTAGTATAPADFEASSGQVTFADGETTRTVTIPVHQDALDEPDEAFTVTLSNPALGAVIAPPGTATVTITNTPAPRVTVRKALLPAGDPGRFDLQIDGATVRASAGDGDQGSLLVTRGSDVTVSEQAAAGSSLSDYTSSIDCGTGAVAGTSRTLVNVTADVTCTIANTLRSPVPAAPVAPVGPAIDVEKTGPATAVAGTTLVYTLEVTNPGNVAFAAANVVVEDPRCTASPPTLTSKNDDPTPDTLNPGDRWTYSCSAATSVGETSVTNVVTVTGKPEIGPTVTDVDEAVTTLTQPVAAPPAAAVAPTRVSQPRVVRGRSALAAPRRCVDRRFTVTVRGRRMASVTFFVDGRRVRRVTRSTTRARLVLDATRFRPGTHRITVRVTFQRSSQTRTRTLRTAIRRCARARIAPRFTG